MDEGEPSQADISDAYVRRMDTFKTIRSWIERDRESAWEAARYDREQRDQLTTRVRFGSVIFNGASLLTVLNAPAFLATVPASITVASAAFFLVGVVSAGVSLIAHQNSLTLISGYSWARAKALDRAFNALEGSDNLDDLDVSQKATDEAHDLFEKTIKPPLSAIVLQNASTGAWLAGSLTVAIAILPSWPWF